MNRSTVLWLRDLLIALTVVTILALGKWAIITVGVLVVVQALYRDHRAWRLE